MPDFTAMVKPFFDRFGIHNGLESCVPALVVINYWLHSLSLSSVSNASASAYTVHLSATISMPILYYVDAKK